MKINAINCQNNSYTNNTNFKARFPLKDIQIFINEAKQTGAPRDYFSRIYALLEFLDKKVPEKYAELYYNGLDYQKCIHIFNKKYSDYIELSYADIFSKITNFHFSLLEKACVEGIHKYGVYSYSKFYRMPPTKYNSLVYENCDKTEQDILDLALENIKVNS